MESLLKDHHELSPGQIRSQRIPPVGTGKSDKKSSTKPMDMGERLLLL
jgi:hypothetical protein